MKLKFIKLFEDEEVWIRMTPRQLTDKMEEIFALDDFDKITAELKKIKDKHEYVQHPPWRRIWDEAMAKWQELDAMRVVVEPEVKKGDPKQPMKDYLTSVGFNYPFIDTLISDIPIPPNDMNTITKTAEKLLDAKGVMKRVKDFQKKAEANPPKSESDIPKFAGNVTPDNFVKACIIVSLLLDYHGEELNTQNFMGMFWIGDYAELMNAWSAVLGEKDKDDDETAINTYIPISQKMKNLYFDEKQSGPRSDMEKNTEKFGLFFKHRTEEKKDFVMSPEDIAQLQKDPQPIIDGIFSMGAFAKVTSILRRVKPEVLKLPNGLDVWKTIVDKWHETFPKQIKQAETGEHDYVNH